MIHELPQLDTHQKFLLFLEKEAFVPFQIEEIVYKEEPTPNGEDVPYVIRYKAKNEAEYRTETAKHRISKLIEDYKFTTESPY